MSIITTNLETKTLFNFLSDETLTYLSVFFNINNSLLHAEYVAILVFLLIAILLAFIIVTLSYLLAVQNPETEKLSPYECGFEPYEDARNTFEIKFYLVAILFIIFDIETMFLLPWSVSLSQLSNLGFWSMIDFIIELGIGFVYVWYVGALEWD
jgi:NADH-quinone oxidoreductase subunit A|tara:strand:+ start:13 stop:474 length:462 start_codon:yes stop_codon:yes gene_type:complete